MNASVNVERNSWRLPPDETVQVADPRSKSAQVKEVIDPASNIYFDVVYFSFSDVLSCFIFQTFS